MHTAHLLWGVCRDMSPTPACCGVSSRTELQSDVQRSTRMKICKSWLCLARELFWFFIRGGFRRTCSVQNAIFISKLRMDRALWPVHAYRQLWVKESAIVPLLCDCTLFDRFGVPPPERVFHACLWRVVYLVRRNLFHTIILLDPVMMRFVSGLWRYRTSLCKRHTDGNVICAVPFHPSTSGEKQS